MDVVHFREKSGYSLTNTDTQEVNLCGNLPYRDEVQRGIHVCTHKYILTPALMSYKYNEH
jgi:hypothetical protein